MGIDQYCWPYVGLHEPNVSGIGSLMIKTISYPLYCAYVFVFYISFSHCSSLNKASRPKDAQEDEKQQKSFVHFVKSMLSNWTFMLFYGINQLGSVFFYTILAKLDFSIAHPLSNAAAFVVTAIMGVFLKEQKLTFTSLLGAIFVLIGIYICISSRQEVPAEISSIVLDKDM